MSATLTPEQLHILLALLRNPYGFTVDELRNVRRMTADALEAQSARIKELELAATRYEKVRRLSIAQYADIIVNMTTGTPFDTLIDALP